jgi:hypothetical protein
MAHYGHFVQAWLAVEKDEVAVLHVALYYVAYA